MSGDSTLLGRPHRCVKSVRQGLTARVKVGHFPVPTSRRHARVSHLRGGDPLSCAPLFTSRGVCLYMRG